MVSVKTKAGTVAEIGRLVTALGDKFETDDDAERDYLATRCPARLHGVIRELPTAAMHLLSAIGEGSVNIVGLSAKSGLLKGTVSKHVQRLVDAGLVSRLPVPGNRKELQLSPTPDGKTLIEVHQRMHDEMDAGRHDFLSRYPAAELSVLAKMLQDLLAADRDGVRLVPAERRVPNAREQT